LREPEKHRTALYASAGTELSHYDVDSQSATLVRRLPLMLPCKVQYIWPHPAAPYLYAACSDGSAEVRGQTHCVVALRMDRTSGALALHGAPAPLPARPIHVTADISGAHLLIAYNDPSSLTVHRIETDGSVGGAARQRIEPDTGIYAHQVRVAPSNQQVIVVARGNDATPSKPEDPGELKVFAYADGQLNPRASVAPGGGYGFGPRHLDFHPSQPWVYVSLERQNTLHMYRGWGDTLEAAPSYVKGTLADPAGARRRQRSGTVHLHPNGRCAYVANRASGTATVDGSPVFIGGENNIAVYAIDPHSGEPAIIQHADTHGIVPRTFALDPAGRLLVAANSVPILAAQGTGMTTIPPSLAVFRVGDDGKLDYVRKYDIDVGSESLFWMGIVALN
jgi:6-phosphogluconolactonase